MKTLPVTHPKHLCFLVIFSPSSFVFLFLHDYEYTDNLVSLGNILNLILGERKKRFKCYERA